MKMILRSVYMRFYEAFLRVALRIFKFSLLRFSFRAVDENDFQHRLYAFLHSVFKESAENFYFVLVNPNGRGK
jgi:hypothetical protein